MYLITNIILLIIKTSALLSSIAIDVTVLLGLLGKSTSASHNGRIVGFVALFMIASLVYLLII